MKIKTIIIVAINCPGYYSLAVHYLKLYSDSDRYLRKRCKILTAEYNTNTDNNFIINELTKLKPDLVAFSCNIWNIQKIIPISKIMKESFHNLKIIFGGQEVSNSSIDYLALHSFIDIVVEGEGEKTFKEIVYSMIEDNYDSLNTISGTHYRHQDELFYNPKSNNLVDLNLLPSPYLEGRIINPDNRHLGVMIEHVRGCPNQCAFCFESKRYQKPRAFPLERVSEELSWARSRGYKNYHIMDPTLCLNNTKKMWELNNIIKEVFFNYDYMMSVEIYAEGITEKNYHYLDCYSHFDIGLQTITSQTNNNINRRLNLDKFIEGFNLVRKLKKQTNIFLIYGFPGDNHDRFLKGVYFVESLKPSIITLNKLLVLNGTPLRHHAAQFDLLFETKPPYEVISNCTYSASDIKKSESFAYKYLKAR